MSGLTISPAGDIPVYMCHQLNDQLQRKILHEVICLCYSASYELFKTQKPALSSPTRTTCKMMISLVSNYRQKRMHIVLLYFNASMEMKKAFCQN